jgi:hypothetical protein
MNKQLLTPILLLLACAALLFMAANLPQQDTEPDICNETDMNPVQEADGTQLLWESLSRQFVSAAQY